MTTLSRRILLVACVVLAATLIVGAAPAKRTRAGVDAIIDAAGTSKPDWWDAVPLSYPDTLDLSRTKEFKGWDAQHNLGVYIMGVVNPDPSKWKPAAKLLHHVLETYKDDLKNVHQTQLELGHVYGNLLGDYARGAYWYKKAGHLSEIQDAQLARFYRLLGDPTMTSEIASAYDMDDTRNAAIVRMWSSIGNFDRALKVATYKAETVEEPDAAYLALGDACRREGKFEEALPCYEKSAASETGTRDIKRNKERAKASGDAVKAARLIDLPRTPDGTYSASAPGFRGDVMVEVAVKAGRIDSVRVAKHKDDWFLSAPTDIPAQIVENQGIKGVDATTGATFTSEAIINATAKALGAAAKQEPKP